MKFRVRSTAVCLIVSFVTQGSLAADLHPVQEVPGLVGGSSVIDGRGYTDTPLVVVGDPSGAPGVSVGARVDPNVPTSYAAGVVSLFLDVSPRGGSGAICSGTVISPDQILTAAHCFDSDDNGTNDILLGSSRVIFNHQPSPTFRGIQSVEIHPDYTGFNNPSISDDLAVVTLDTPIPTGVPIYELSDEPFNFLTDIVMVGYGRTGNGIDGFGPGANFFTKRSGRNIAAAFQLDDEGSGSREIWLMDFDGPTTSTSTLDRFGTLGNDIETTIGGGDSGGPSFVWNDADGDGEIQADELTLFGVNTFSRGGGSIPESPLFGSQSGGIVVSTYERWISGQLTVQLVPEPSSLSVFALGLFLLSRRRVQRG